MSGRLRKFEIGSRPKPRAKFQGDERCLGWYALVRVCASCTAMADAMAVAQWRWAYLRSMSGGAVCKTNHEAREWESVILWLQGLSVCRLALGTPIGVLGEKKYPSSSKFNFRVSTNVDGQSCLSFFSLVASPPHPLGGSPPPNVCDSHSLYTGTLRTCTEYVHAPFVSPGNSSTQSAAFSLPRESLIAFPTPL